MTLGANTIGSESAKKIVEAWISSHFEGGRSLPKIKRLREIEAAVMKDNRFNKK
jgi:ribose 5-phosphate isomerase B